MQITFGKHKVSSNHLTMALGLLFYAGVAAAQSTGGMPWEGPLCGLANAFRGPTALAIASIAFFAAAAAFMWGEEIAGISKKLVTIFMAVSIMLGSVGVVGWIAVKMGAAAAACTS